MIQFSAHFVRGRKERGEKDRIKKSGVRNWNQQPGSSISSSLRALRALREKIVFMIPFLER
jgi:hypothetical protein